MRGNHTLMFLSLLTPLSRNKLIKLKKKKGLIREKGQLWGSSCDLLPQAPSAKTVSYTSERQRPASDASLRCFSTGG